MFIQDAIKDGHYLGAHSDKHLLYNDWSKDKKLLIDYQEFSNDIQANYEAMKPFGITKEKFEYFLPPYEWNNDIITQWADRNELTLINYTPGTLSHADYTIPSDKNYRSSKEIHQSILDYESEKGLNGFLLLSHLGSDSKRTDKFYEYLNMLISNLEKKNYEFYSLKALLE
jgi:peptidoglycan/xylan/chitin deacetylase (PgdA/CDA1 family)